MTISSVSGGSVAAPRVSTSGLDAKIASTLKQIADVQNKIVQENNSTTDNAKTKQELVAAYQVELTALQAQLQSLQQQKAQAQQSSAQTTTTASARAARATSSASANATADAGDPSKTTGFYLDAEA